MGRSATRLRFGVNILSIQSHVAYGHVGNSAAVFALQRLGCEVWPVHTVQFSNHTGYGAWTGEVFAAGAIEGVVSGIAERGVLASCDGVLSGYVGSLETGAAILDAVGRVKAANPGAVYCCDPVIGNRARGVFVRPGICRSSSATAPCRRRGSSRRTISSSIVSPAATPPIWRRCWRRDRRPPRQGPRRDPRHFGRDQRDAGRPPRRGRLRRRGTMARAHAQARDAGNGAGDVIAALFLYHYLRTGAVAEALRRATSSVFGLLPVETLAAGARNSR